MGFSVCRFGLPDAAESESSALIGRAFAVPSPIARSRVKVVGRVPGPPGSFGRVAPLVPVCLPGAPGSLPEGLCCSGGGSRWIGGARALIIGQWRIVSQANGLYWQASPAPREAFGRAPRIISAGPSFAT